MSLTIGNYIEVGRLVNLDCVCGFEVSVHEPYPSAEETLLTAVNIWNDGERGKQCLLKA